MNIKGRLKRIEDAAGMSEPLTVVVIKTNIDVSDEGPFNFECVAADDISGQCLAYKKAERNGWRGYNKPVIHFFPPCVGCKGPEVEV